MSVYSSSLSEVGSCEVYSAPSIEYLQNYRRRRSISSRMDGARTLTLIKDRSESLRDSNNPLEFGELAFVPES